MSAPAIQTHEAFQRRYINLDALPVDPDGWCVVEYGIDKHTALCAHGVEQGGPRLCDMWAERDQRDRKQESARVQARIADAELRRDGHFDLPTGGYDGELARRQANTRRSAL